MVERRNTIIVAMAVVLALGILGVWALTPDSSVPSVPEGLTEITDAATLKNTLELTHVGIATSTSYVGHKVYLVRGTLKNVSEMPIRLVEVKMVFLSYDQKPVQENVHRAFDPKWKPLEPGTEYRFEAAFENMPRTWNYRIPEIQIVKVAY